MSLPRNDKPLFFIHTIDPILWPILYLFVKPFFQIICFQFNRVKESGFHRLEIGTLSAQEYESCNRQGIAFAKEYFLTKRLKTEGVMDGTVFELTNHFAKDYLRYVTDLALSAKMIEKLRKKQGVYILPRYCSSRELRDATAEFMAKHCGLKAAPGWEAFVGGWYNPLCLVLKVLMYWVGFGVVFLKRQKHAETSLAPEPENLQNKIVSISYIPGELEPDMLRKLSAGFFIDNKRVMKEDVLFLAKESLEAEQWRRAGYCIHSIFDLISKRMIFQSFQKAVILFFSHPAFVLKFLILFSPKQLINLILCELLVQRYRFRGLMYTNSDVTVEPIMSVCFRDRALPIVLYFYSASTFCHPMWSYLQADHVFVWNQDMIHFLNSHPQVEDKKYYVSGPLMQVEDRIEKETLRKLRNELGFNDPRTKKTIGIFDIAPIKEHFLEESRFVQNPKLTTSIHRDFLFDIFVLSKTLPEIKFLLKPKRWTAKHDIAQDIRDYLETHKSNIVLLPPSLNPQAAIQNCDLVICFPFTSIFYAAIQKNIPAIFYYPFEDQGLKQVDEFKPFTIYGRTQLQEWFQEFQEGRKTLPMMDDITRMCGLPAYQSVREQFISRLHEIFYAA